MTIKCYQCQVDLDDSDAFCRRCGTVLAQEASYSEISGPPPATTGPTPIVEVSALVKTQAETQVQTQAETVLDKLPVMPGVARLLSRKVGAKLGKALKSEQGKKLAQGAGALAVAVSVELVSHAARRLSKAPLTPEQRLPARSPVSLADAMLKALEESIARPAAGDEVEEIYIHERITVRRINRKRSS